MQLVQPTSLEAALAAVESHPDAVPIQGGTDVMVEMNFDRHRPATVLDLGRVSELRGWEQVDAPAAFTGTRIEGDTAIRLGAGVTWTTIERELATLLPGLAIASRTVGSPQIRNRGTVAGNLGTASPAGDGLPPLVACGAVVEVASASRGTRFVPVEDWIVRPKHSVRAADELITAVYVPVQRGPQQFSKIGTRNAMVISVASFAIAFDIDRQQVGTGIGSAGPTVNRALDAERYLEQSLADAGQWAAPHELEQEIAMQFGEHVATASRPIDDVRGTAAYRRHAVSVMARRTLNWAWKEHVASCS